MFYTHSAANSLKYTGHILQLNLAIRRLPNLFYLLWHCFAVSQSEPNVIPEQKIVHKDLRFRLFNGSKNANNYVF